VPQDEVAVTRPDVLARALPEGAVVQVSQALTLDPEPRQVSSARRFVAGAVPDLDADTADTLLLLVSELVTNAVVHARTELEVAVAVTDEDVVVAVHDLDLGRREQRSGDRDGGRGLGLVRSLAVDSGMIAHPGGGKSAWFRLHRARASA
jgi:two-component sensor histidine kinase